MEVWTEGNKRDANNSPLTPFNIKRLEREGYEVSEAGWEERKADLEFENFCREGM